MSERTDTTGQRIARGLLAGVIAGAVASFAMDRFQALTSSSDSDDEPATEKAADRIAQATAGQEVPPADKPLAGQAVHYALGIALGAAYGIAAELRPEVTVGYGSAYALGTATLLDQAAVPAAGLGDPPWQASIGTTLYSYASHLVFGGVTELVRRQVSATLSPSS